MVSRCFVRTLLALLSALVPVQAFGQTYSQVTSGGGYSCLFGQGTLSTVAGQSSNVETWIDGLANGYKTCYIGTMNGFFACHAAKAPPDAVVVAKQAGCGRYFFLYWTSKSNIYLQNLITFATTNLGTISHQIYVAEPAHHNPVQCPVDGPYWCPGTPIIIPLTPDAQLTLSAPNVVFDLDADGVPETISWPEDGAAFAFLAIDSNHNGMIDNASELFGDHTVEGASNGFSALARLAESHANVAAGKLQQSEVDKNSALFQQLVLWTDVNRDGVSQAGELRPARELLSAIGLGVIVDPKAKKDAHGNQFWYKGWVRYLDGSERQVDDPVLVALFDAKHPR